MRENEKENKLLEDIRNSLDRQVENLDDRTVRALKSMRLEALESMERKRGYFGVPRWLTATGIATAVVLVATVSLFFVSSQNSLQVKSTEDFEILSANDQQELYKDLDFYRWLAEEEDAS
jgi:type VI protein secretion system component VasF